MNRTITCVIAGVIALGFGGGVARAIPVGIVNPSFETGGLSNWQFSGAVFTATTFLTAPSNGLVQAVISKNGGVLTSTTLASFLGVSAGAIATAAGVDLDDLDFSVGSALRQNFTTIGFNSLKFDYNMFTPIPTPQTAYPESILAVLDGQVYLVNNTTLASFPNNNGDNQWTGFLTFTGLPQLGPGSHDIAVAAIGLPLILVGTSVDNFVLTPQAPVVVATPEPVTGVTGMLALAALGWAGRRRGI